MPLLSLLCRDLAFTFYLLSKASVAQCIEHRANLETRVQITLEAEYISAVVFIWFYRKTYKYWDIYVCANSVDIDQTALKEQSDQDLHCLPFCLHLLEHYCIVKSYCFILRTPTVVRVSVPIFGVFTVCCIQLSIIIRKEPENTKSSKSTIN